MIPLLALWGCKSPIEEAPLTLLPATQRLTRMSLDLRGHRPTVAELERVADNEAEVTVLLDTFLESPELEGRLVEVFQEHLRTRSENIEVVDLELVEDPERVLLAAGEEPLRLMARVAVSDRPWTEVLTADWTMANEDLAGIFPVDYPDEASGWQEVHYTDGRPTAGVLSTNGFYWRYPSTDSNKQRKRANQISRMFSCRDFLTTEIPFDDDIDLLNEEAVDNAIRDNPSCVGCHQDLDPIASYLWGFQYAYEDGFSLFDGAVYHPERERAWQDETEVPPGWYGQNGETLTDLGHQIAADGRFVKCATQAAYATLLRREVDADDREAIEGHQRAFIEGGLTYKALLRSIMTDPIYTADEDDPRIPSRKWMTPDLMVSQLEELTGFRWETDNADLLSSERQGLLTLAGGLDGATVTAAADRPNTTVVLVQDRLASAAAAWTVEQGALLEVNPTGNASTAERRLEIARLVAVAHSRLVSSDSREVDAYLELYDAVFALDDDPSAAWTAVLTGLFRDPDFAAY